LVKGCVRPGAKRGLCLRHYDRWWKARRKGRVVAVEPRDAPGLEIPAIANECGSRCDLIWLAGLLEGEGTFGLNGRPPCAYPVISVEMCAEDVVRRAARILGVTSVYRREPDEPAWSATFTAKIAGHDAAGWMRELRPYMGLRRLVAIDRALAAYQPIRLTEVPETCLVSGCEKPHRSRGLCHAHYMSWSRDRAKGRIPRITPLR
jgi:hypothetical protein